jgi:hypothetical protein
MASITKVFSKRRASDILQFVKSALCVEFEDLVR